MSNAAVEHAADNGAQALSSAPVSPGGRASGLWLDAPDALRQLPGRAGNDAFLQKVGRDLIETGFSIIPKFQDCRLIAEAKRDYDHYLETYADEAERSRDEFGRQFRLTNFHMYSDAAMKLAKNPEVMLVLDFIFGREAAVHTSLTFQYSTMQQLHRDAPYFHTFPESQFVGVWTALQGIHPDSGPLSYVPGSHRLQIDQWALYNEALARCGGIRETARREALGTYQRMIVEMAAEFGPRQIAVLDEGDIAIWHPQLIHGGSPAANPGLKRQSMVVHCCPADTFVFVDDVFLSHQTERAPLPYYSFAESLGRKHGNFSVPGFMNSI